VKSLKHTETYGCIDNERQFEAAMLQKQFSGDILPTFVQIMVMPLNSSNFLHPTPWMK